MKLVVGLGNIGDRFKKTRHNVGFEVVDFFQQEVGTEEFKNELNSSVSRGEGFFLVKPNTFMNLSGESVRKIAHFYKVELSDILIIHDELHLPLGEVKLSVGRGHGGHNGVRDLIQKLGSKDFLRIRIGVGDCWNSEKKDFVLSRFSPKEWGEINQQLETVTSIIQGFVSGSNFQELSNKFN